MTNKEAIERLKNIHFCGPDSLDASIERMNDQEAINMGIAALEKKPVEAQGPISDQDLKDLDILRRVKEGKLAKSLCRDYVIYNGEWYRNHKWDAPSESLEPIAPYTENADDSNKAYWTCGNCGNFLYKESWVTETLRDNRPKYCSECGRKVKWK